MRKLLQDIQADLSAFIEQRRDATLIVGCDTVENAHVLNVLQAIDEGGSPDHFWTFSEPFETPRAYAEAVVHRFIERVEGVRAIQSEEEQASWPAPPASLQDPTRSVIDLLRDAMTFSRTLLPSLDGHRAVWTLCPTRVDDPRAYAALMSSLLVYDPLHPWCHHLRIIVRDPREAPALSDLPRQMPGVQRIETDLGVDAIAKSFEAEAADEQQPLPLRLQALLVLAGMDYSHRRYDAALRKYRILHRYYGATGNRELHALTLNGMGETYVGLRRDREALQHFEAALTPALETESSPVLLNVTLNMANLMLRHRQWADAEAYYDSAARLARAGLNATTTIQALENKGVCQCEQRRYGEAVATWNEAASLARTVEEPDLLKAVLQRLQDLYQRGRMMTEQREVARELSLLAA